MKAKKTTAMLLAVLTLASMTMAVSAETTSTAATTSSAICSSTGTQRQAKMGQMATSGKNLETRAALNAKRGQMMQNRASNLSTRGASLQLCSQIEKAIAVLKSSGQTLSAENQALLADYKAQITTLHQELTATKGQIKDLMTTLKGYRDSKDFVLMDKVFDQIAAIQQTRNEKITSINDLLKKILALFPAQQ